MMEDRRRLLVINEDPNDTDSPNGGEDAASNTCWTACCKIPSRYILAIMMLLGFTNAFAQRMVFNIALVAMVNFTQPDTNGTSSDECAANTKPGQNSTIQTPTGVFNWDPTLQGFLLGAFYYGYPLTQLPGGYLAERFGAKLALGFVGLSTGVLSLLIPLVAQWNVYALIVLRALQGLGQGPLYSSCVAMWARWAPPNERARMYAIVNSGSTLGSVISMAVAGVMCASDFLGGWPSPFYLFGSLSIIWFVFWMLIVHDTPASHPRIDPKERAFIERETESLDTVKYMNPPWCSMLTSLPIWGIFIVLITDNIGFYISFNCLPLYMEQVLKFDISQDGFVSALPYLVQFPTIFFVGWSADRLRKSKVIKTVHIRRIYVIIGDLMPAMFLTLATFVGCNQVASVSFFVTGIAFNGFMSAGPAVSIMDIAPMYAGTIMGSLNGIANVGGIIAPALISGIAGDSPKRTGWATVFYIALGTYIFGVLVFCILITGEELPWSKKSRIEGAQDQTNVPEVTNHVQST